MAPRSPSRPARAYPRPRLESLEDRAVPAGFTDGFEGATLNPFWSVEEHSGSVVFPSTTLVHGGSQAIRLDTYQTPAHKGVNLMHFFDTPQYGRVSIWVYDTGAGAISSNALYMDIYNPDAGRATWGVWDFDFQQSGTNYRMATDDVHQVHTGEVQTSFNRTTGWHQWVVEAVPGSVTYSMDGHALHTVPIDLPFTRVLFGMGAPNWRPAWTVSFDDFEFVPFNQPDLQTKSLTWNTTQGGVDLGYDITGAELSQPRTAGLYWSADNAFDPSDTLALSIPTAQAVGSYGPIHVSDADLGTPPAGARYLLLVLDPTNQVDEADETNNVLALAIPNRPPVVDAGPDGAAIRGLSFSSAGSFADPDADTWSATVDYGDGTGVQPLHLNPDKTFALDHTYTSVGSYTVTVTVSDGQGGVGTDTAVVSVDAVAVRPIPTAPDDTELVIAGTAGNDKIRVVPGRDGVVVKINGSRIGTFPATDRIVGHGLAGDDDIEVAGGVTIPAWLYGGDGNDRLKAGGGSAVLVGGAGVDRVVGGRSRDLLIGGSGADRLIGLAGDDLLIAGLTVHESDPAALRAIQREWTRTDRTAAERVANLKSGTGLNGPVVLTAATVSDDASTDLLTGSAGLDWVLFDATLDRVTDSRAGTL